MWFIVSKKKHHRVLDEWGAMERELRDEIESLGSTVAEQQGNIAAKDALLKSTEREQVLFDLQNALNLIRDYQRSFNVAAVADPKISQANALLKKYGIECEESASYLGFQRTVSFHEPDVSDGTAVDLAAIAPTEKPKKRWEREEEEWGDEAYGSGTVRIEAEAIDEGDDKEDGYTRARINFYDGESDEAWIDTPHSDKA